MPRKKTLHSYPHKSYLPIFDSIELECSSLLHMRRNECIIVQKSPECRNFERHSKCPISNTQALHARFKVLKFSDCLLLD